jgi:hypothetical protein
VCKEAKKGKEEGAEKVFLSTRKHINIPKSVINLDDFQTELFLNVVAKANSLLSKKVVREEIASKDSVHILIIYSFKIVQFCSYAVCSISFLTLLLLHTYVWNDKLAMLPTSYWCLPNVKRNKYYYSSPNHHSNL